MRSIFEPMDWILVQNDRIVPIPGTRRIERLQENRAALELELTSEDLDRFDGIAPGGVAAGARSPEAGMRVVSR